MTQSNTIEGNIQKWLLNKGFPFEIECNTELQKHGFITQPALHYLDKTTDNYREIDIVASKSLSINDFTFNLALVIECKSSEQPWLVFINDPLHSKVHPVNQMLATNNGKKLVSSIDQADKNTFVFSFNQGEKIGFNFLQVSEKNRDKDYAFEALMQSGNAALHLREQGNKTNLRFCNIYIPVVIVNDKLFQLDTTSNISNMDISEIHFCKHTRRFAFSDVPIITHHIVSGKYFSDYCKQVSKDFDYFMEKYKNEIKRISEEEPTNSKEGKYNFL